MSSKNPKRDEAFFKWLANNISGLEWYLSRAISINYSARNVAAILLQYPQATKVLSKSRWERNEGGIPSSAKRVIVNMPASRSTKEKATGFNEIEVYADDTPLSSESVSAVACLEKVFYMAKSMGFVVGFAPMEELVKVVGNVICLRKGLCAPLATYLALKEVVYYTLLKEKGDKEKAELIRAKAEIASYCVCMKAGLDGFIEAKSVRVSQRVRSIILQNGIANVLSETLDRIVKKRLFKAFGL